jgi:peptidoglycan hydrolase-like protein with peptidoglycan-binding domain
MAPTPDRITEIQTALARENAYPGDPNGKWDAATIDAMKRFQTAQGLSPTGKIDALTLQRLGLGSDVAGKGAPTPLATPDEPATQSPSAQSPSASIQSDNQLR